MRINETKITITGTLKGEAAKLTHLIESASLKKSIWLKIMKKYLFNSWISFLHFPMDEDCIENY